MKKFINISFMNIQLFLQARKKYCRLRLRKINIYICFHNYYALISNLQCYMLIVHEKTITTYRKLFFNRFIRLILSGTLGAIITITKLLLSCFISFDMI